MKIKGELQNLGKFDLGKDKEGAYALFRKLKGSTDADSSNVLFMELTETVRDLPINIKIISCTLDELASNCRTIAKELFRRNNLEP
ncbi:MAG: hypothetical protein J7578_03805 [Chitinophagaceae bacterium]|nr:hypothetical protein [Chitinophagaceae bacterium]